MEENYDSPREKIQNKLIDVMDCLSDSCRKFLDMIKHQSDSYITVLDKERLNMTIKEIVCTISSIFCTP